MKQVLVAGGAGFLGSRRCEWLMAAGNDVLIASSAIFLYRPVVPLADYAVFRCVEPLRAEMVRANIHFAAGEYWTPWPLVFLALADGRDAVRLAYRAEGNNRNLMRAVDEELRRFGALKAICGDAEVGKCVEDVRLFTGRAWQWTTTTCGKRCAVIALAP